MAQISKTIFTKQFGYSKPAIYKIKVLGEIPINLSDRLFGMRIKYKKKSGKVFSILIGLMRDQAALSGVLNNLHSLHMTVISVKILDKLEIN